MHSKSNHNHNHRESETKLSLYPAWCKRCGNCIAFCPRGALDRDPWGYPVLARPDRCTMCHLCEMLCPDFAISVGHVPQFGERQAAGAPPSQQAASSQAHHSAERLAPEPPVAETDEQPREAHGEDNKGGKG